MPESLPKEARPFQNSYRLCLICRKIGHIVKQCPWLIWKANQPDTSPPPANIESKRPSPPFDPCSHSLSIKHSNHALCQQCQTLDKWHQIRFAGNDSDLSQERLEHSLGDIKHLSLISTCPSCRLIFDITYLADEDIPSIISGSELVVMTATTISRLEKDVDCREPEAGTTRPYAKCVYTSVKLTVAHWGDNCVTAKELYGDPHPSLGMSSARMGIRSSRSSMAAKRGRPSVTTRSTPLCTYEASTPVEKAMDAIALADVGEGATSLGVRKVNPQTPDYNVIKDWLLRCEALHPSTCRPIVSRSLRQIKLIDVQTRQIVMYPLEGCDYVALSYVWGGVKQGSYKLGDTLATVPATLEDAMVVTRNLGKRYLWADSLCIDQMDDADKGVQIALMSAIYSGAWASIICLSGMSADSGLPRVGTLKDVMPQLTCDIGGKQMLSVMPTLAQQVSWSYWASRAWTFQEGLLSPRCLFFTNHQVYFECNSFQCCESLDDSHSPFHFSSNDQQRAAIYQIMQAAGDGRPDHVVGSGVLRDPFRQMSGMESGQVDDDHHVYHKLMISFTKRKMTYDADSINAFSAMLTRLQETCQKSGFVHGLPVTDLPRALLWYHSSPSRRRIDFPTWSWAGWEGEVGEFVLDGASRFVALFMPPLRVWKAGNKGLPELVYSSSPTQQILKVLEERGKDRRLDDNMLIDFERDPIFHLAKGMDDGIPSIPQDIGRNELVIDGIVLRLMLTGSRYGHPRDGRLEIQLDGVYGTVKFQGHDAETLVNTRHGREQDFLLLSREPSYFNKRVYIALLLIDWDGDVARRVGVATIEFVQDRFDLLKRLEPQRMVLKLK